MGFKDLRHFNLAMLAKQGWRLVQNQDSLLFRCLKARYFPRCSFLEATDSPTSSFTWKSILAAKPIIQRGSCWRVGSGASIRVLSDAWIPNHPTNKVLYPTHSVEEELMVSELIDPDTRWWDREFIMQNFNREDGEAILRVPLSRRIIPDSLLWTFTKSREYTVRSGYHVARQLQKEVGWAESSSGYVGGVIWKMLWKLKVPNKIKVFGWRACRNILPARMNLVHRRIIQDNRCEVCKLEAETGIHALWNCGVAWDVWASCSARLQKCAGDQADMLQLMEELIGRLSSEELEFFLVQAWFIWNQRNGILHGKQMQPPEVLIKRAQDFLSEFRQANVQLSASATLPSPMRWRPPPADRFKLNFDASIFQEGGASGFGAIICNDRGEVMAALSAKGPPVTCSEEAEILACRSRCAVEFAVECGFSELILEGDNQGLMNALNSRKGLSAQFGHIIEDVICMLNGLNWYQVVFVKRSANTVAHVLARCAKDLLEDVVWIEDSPSPAVEALYFDSSSI